MEVLLAEYGENTAELVCGKNAGEVCGENRRGSVLRILQAQYVENTDGAMCGEYCRGSMWIRILNG